MNSGSIFQNRVDRALREWKCCMPYIDNIIIYSKTIDEHLEHMKEVFKTKRGRIPLKIEEMRILYGTNGILQNDLD
jgi:hypothetical protein